MDRAALASLVDDLEARAPSRWRDTARQAAQAGDRARELGDERLLVRTRVLLADAAIRDGRTAEGGRLAREAASWAERVADGHVLACSHRVLCQFWANIGDPPTAAIHAVEAVSQLPAGTPPYLRARHLTVLGIALSENGSLPDAVRRFEEAQRISAELDDPASSMMIVANLASALLIHGDPAGAVEAVRRLRELSVRWDRPLDVPKLNIVAAVAVETGDYDEVERTLRPLVEDVTAPHQTGDSSVQQLRSLSRANRLAGRHGAAQRDLDRAFGLARDRDLGFIAADLLEEQAALYAGQDRFREAYTTLQEFHAALAKLQSAQRDVRARAVQAMFETREARQDSDRFREMAHRDPLTGLHNRRYLDEQLPARLRDAAVAGEPVAVAIVDLDHFKRINDSLSHDAGDRVLQHLGRLLAEAAPEPGFPARLGGEEFVLVLPGTDEPAAVRRCEQLGARVRDYDWTPITGRLPVTASIGVAVTSGGTQTRESLLAEADAHLYEAKRGGRDRVVSAGSAPVGTPA